MLKNFRELFINIIDSQGYNHAIDNLNKINLISMNNTELTESEKILLNELSKEERNLFSKVSEEEIKMIYEISIYKFIVNRPLTFMAIIKLFKDSKNPLTVQDVAKHLINMNLIKYKLKHKKSQTVIGSQQNTIKKWLDCLCVLKIIIKESKKMHTKGKPTQLFSYNNDIEINLPSIFYILINESQNIIKDINILLDEYNKRVIVFKKISIDGIKETKFECRAIINSLINAGASCEIILTTLEKLSEQLNEEMTRKDIFFKIPKILNELGKDNIADKFTKKYPKIFMFSDDGKKIPLTLDMIKQRTIYLLKEEGFSVTRDINELIAYEALGFIATEIEEEDTISNQHVNDIINSSLICLYGKDLSSLLNVNSFKKELGANLRRLKTLPDDNKEKPEQLRKTIEILSKMIIIYHKQLFDYKDPIKYIRNRVGPPKQDIDNSLWDMLNKGGEGGKTYKDKVSDLTNLPRIPNPRNYRKIIKNIEDILNHYISS